MPTCRKRLSVPQGENIIRARKLKLGAHSIRISTGASSVRQKVNRDLPAGSLTRQPGTGTLLGFAPETLLPGEPFADVQVPLHGFQPVLPVRLEGEDAAPRFSGEPHAGKFARPGPHRAVAVRGRLIAGSRSQPFGCDVPGDVAKSMPDHVLWNDKVLPIGAASAQAGRIAPVRR